MNSAKPDWYLRGELKPRHLHLLEMMQCLEEVAAQTEALRGAATRKFRPALKAITA